MSLRETFNDPREIYSLRVEERTREAADHFQRFRRVGMVRLAFIALLILLLITWLLNLTTLWWLIIPALGFIALAPAQQRISEQRRRSERAVKFYHYGIARIDDEWSGKGATGTRFVDPAHPYAEDLDIFGHGSLFELLSIARTQVGEETLARWLLQPASTEILRKRQAAVAELRSSLDLREDLALLAEGVHSGADAQTLVQWAAAPPWSTSIATKWIARLLAASSLVGLGLWFGGFGWQIFLGAVLAGQLFALRFRAETLRVISDVDVPGKDLQLLVEVLRRLEQERFQSPLLVQLRAELDVAGHLPSQQIARLRRLIELLDSMRNMIFAPLAFILLWPLQCAIAIESWRQESGAAIGRWLAAVGELEALSSLAGYAFEHPDDPFPELVESSVCFDGELMGHPLVPVSRNVRTSLHLSTEPAVMIVSGSNMSGKSTLLRTVGTNTVLALAGAPVRAKRLQLSVLQIGASIRVQDSLQAGASRFYAEITRLRQIVDLTKHPAPVIFLLDEILHGTNSHDRKIGAEGVVKGLIERGSIGLVTTHDLALTQIVEDLGSRAANVHFEDHLEAGRMTFDYVLRPGVLQKSNALELMRSVGLEV
jgi:ABC-type multidrug transport system fused ATPase/permease subunit